MSGTSPTSGGTVTSVSYNYVVTQQFGDHAIGDVLTAAPANMANVVRVVAPAVPVAPSAPATPTAPANATSAGSTVSGGS